jgi:hypothetical protein
LNNSNNINNEDEQNNFFNFNTSLSKIFKKDNQKNRQNYNFSDESKTIYDIDNKLNVKNINIHIIINGLKNLKNEHISIKKELKDLKHNLYQSEAFKLNIKNINLFPHFFLNTN